MPESTGLYRITVTLRTPADWNRLEQLGVVVLERTARGRTADGQENADRKGVKSAASRTSAVILADADQLEALARLRFEPRGTDELGALVMRPTSPSSPTPGAPGMPPRWTTTISTTTSSWTSRTSRPLPRIGASQARVEGGNRAIAPWNRDR